LSSISETLEVGLTTKRLALYICHDPYQPRASGWAMRQIVSYGN